MTSKELKLSVQYTITIPVFDWKQIGGDRNPGAHGGLIARADGQCIEVREIQPTRAYIGDSGAAEVGDYPHPGSVKTLAVTRYRAR